MQFVHELLRCVKLENTVIVTVTDRSDLSERC